LPHIEYEIYADRTYVICNGLWPDVKKWVDRVHLLRQYDERSPSIKANVGMYLKLVTATLSEQ